MFKYTVLFSAVLCLVNSQRPWHAGSSNRLPMVLPQYIDERLAVEQAAQSGQAVQAGQEIQPGQSNVGVQPTASQPIPTIQSNIGVQPVQTYQPSLTADTYQPGQTVQGYHPGQTVQGYHPGQTVQGYHPGQTVQAAQGPQGSQGATGFSSPDVGLSNRIDGSSGSNVITAFPTTTSTTINPADLPVDAHGDVDLVNRIKTWPREKQPFWYINWQAIQAHRGDVSANAQVAQVQPNPRSFFAG
ncbi:glutenin, high molecular weight subunit PW212-like [Harpegnathos saltator]|uniref:glutenin, high molecular weight subunit PW212-like n=1 Tax=Harpegnathos saltator TaxID=610380 RepID=UPI000DBEE748|nr:glutenin, high molecular weight subunit PW212-like [Harpegnathos saltator]